MYRLSHYTTPAGLGGIAESKTLWATHMLDVQDTSEYFYGWHGIQKAAIEYCMSRVPDNIKNPDFKLDETAEGATEKFREWTKTTNDYGLLYMTSFARARNDDEEERGIRTLWEICADQHKGYCLQFDLADVRDMAGMDAKKGSYEWLAVEPVKYGIDLDTPEFRELRFQLGEQYLLFMARQLNNWKIPLELDQHWPPSVLSAKIFQYCGTHKDPFYSDEREVRILAYPHERAVPTFLTGFASPKKVRRAPNGKRYIAIGEYWRPGISPKRIIVGTKAEKNIEHIIAKFDKRPEVAYASAPVR